VCRALLATYTGMDVEVLCVHDTVSLCAEGLRSCDVLGAKGQYPCKSVKMLKPMCS
jgi:hypothetical protein